MTPVQFSGDKHYDTQDGLLESIKNKAESPEMQRPFEIYVNQPEVVQNIDIKLIFSNNQLNLKFNKSKENDLNEFHFSG